MFASRMAAGPEGLPPSLCGGLFLLLFARDCVPVHGSNPIMKFADDTRVEGPIRGGNDETAYRDEVQHLAANTQKTK